MRKSAHCASLVCRSLCTFALIVVVAPVQVDAAGVPCKVDADCDDAIFCNGFETCDGGSGACQPGTPPSCDDGVACTTDMCDAVLDDCVNEPVDASCDNGLFCDGAEVCDSLNDCQAGTPVLCDDGVDCTIDSCDEEADACDFTPDDALCDNDLFCDGNEVCDPIAGCMPGTAPDCDDAISCTADSCDEANDLCLNTPIDGNCDDGLFCNGAETCDAALDCQPGASPCNKAELCDETGDACVECLIDGDCDDGLFCNGAETCDASGTCQFGLPPDCDDGVLCTIDACDEDLDACTNTVSDAACDNGLFCDGTEFCDAELDCQSGAAPNCNDGVLCTTDSCDEKADACTNVPEDAACDNGLFCDGAEVCDPIEGCLAGGAIDCDDGVACTTDSCDEAADVCTHIPDDATCDNGMFCDGAESCDALLGCQAGTAPDCDDAVTCTIDTCDETNDACANAPEDTACDNGLFCDGAETCDAALGCQPGTAPNCDDGVGCTVDACDEDADACTHTTDDALCDDGTFCNGAETCDAALDCQPGTTPCNKAELCDEIGDACVGCLGDGDCDDGLFCNGAETCDETGTCVPGTAPNCDDGVSCTVDSCNEETDVCDNLPDNASCDDGLFCNGAETCDAAGDCTPGIAPCTDQQLCDEENDRCVACLGDGDCDDGLFCNGAETCDASGTCQAGSPPNCDDGVACTTDSCDEDADACTNTPDDAACDNGLFCDGAEACDAVLGCQSGTAPNCDDGVSCTTDACDEESDTCTHAPDDAACDNGLFCDGAETCDAVLDCQSGTAPNCDDGVACTIDSCDEGADACVNAPDDAACDNGLFCDGAETCDAVLDCQSGTAPNCDDGVDCTVDACDEEADTCTNAPDDALCDDGTFCNGAETCDAALDCQPGSDPCTKGTQCDEENDRCSDCLSDADCDDGLFCNGVETCDPSGACAAGTPVVCDDGVDCTIDSCDEDLDTCEFAVDDFACDDGAFCNGEETCDAIEGCLPGTPPDCDDGVGCTNDTCDEEFDVCANDADDSLCDDGLFCNGVETCDEFADCQPGMSPCGAGTLCDEANDRCSQCLVDADCDDDLFCNGAEVCAASGACEPGTPPDCDDGVSCTADTCNEETDACDNVADDAACDDGMFCNGSETCDAELDCQPGTAPDCSDGVDCTVDSCDEEADLCTNTADNTLCDNAVFCDGAETCDPKIGCIAGTTPDCSDGVDCTIDICDTELDACTSTPDDAACDDGFFCTGVETCDPETGCASPGDPCTDGLLCDETNDRCSQCLVDADCDDGLHCNGLETCDPSGTCAAGTPPDCNDDVSCTIDSCNEETDACDNDPSDALCDDGLFCTGTETCDALLDCQPGTNPCGEGTLCDEENDRCSACLIDADCDDGLFCNGEEVCDPEGNCAASTPPNCDDGVGCTIDSCNEETDVCDNETDDALCDDGLFCNGGETCDALLDCQPGTAPDCDDGVSCTVDSCDEESDTCVSTADDALCDDNLFCNGQETCDAKLDCQPGTEPDCDDAIDCTADSCDEVNDRCANAPDDAVCDNGIFCDGAEFCDPARGCSRGDIPPCGDDDGKTVGVCNAETDSCMSVDSDEACQTPSLSGARLSDNLINRVADDFTVLETGLLTDLSWWGTVDGNSAPECDALSTNEFRVTYYRDAGGRPGNVLGGPFLELGTCSVSGTTCRSDSECPGDETCSSTLRVGMPEETGRVLVGGTLEHVYKAGHPPVRVTAGSCYWVEIANESGLCSWRWQFAPSGNTRVFADATPEDQYMLADEDSGDQAFCIGRVLGDSDACNGRNDTCLDAAPITGEGEFFFDNSAAPTDGPGHAACESFGESRIESDVWYRWTASCSGEIFVRTCERTIIDTRIAVYHGDVCPVDDARLVACNDDRCAVQSMATFFANEGQDYLIRVGVFPGTDGGVGSFNLTCGPPENDNCPGTGFCCSPKAAKGCEDGDCCRRVCACDPLCCTLGWDDFCAGEGFSSGCGAAVLCPQACALCPSGEVTWIDPPNGVVDARVPLDRATLAPLGITTVRLFGPTGATAECFDVCETKVDLTPNEIISVNESNGVYELTLARPITAGAVTTVTYRDADNPEGASIRLISHPANVNADGASGAPDITALIDILNGLSEPLYGDFSADIDANGGVGAPDITALIDLLNGAGPFDPWLGVQRPSADGVCP